LPQNVEITHVSLNDGSLEGLALRDRCVRRPVHPEAKPGRMMRTASLRVSQVDWRLEIGVW